MGIKLYPRNQAVVGAEVVKYSTDGETLRVGDTSYDLSQVADTMDIDNDLIVGEVFRRDGDVHVQIIHQYATIEIVRVEPDEDGPQFEPYDDYKAIPFKLVDEPSMPDVPDFTSVADRKTAISRERDRRIRQGFSFNGKVFQSDDASKARITGAATLAGFAVVSGAAVGDLRWADADNDFLFISADDTHVPMDAHDCLAFGKAAAKHETQLIFAAKGLKTMDPVPMDFTDDKYWPTGA